MLREQNRTLNSHLRSVPNSSPCFFFPLTGIEDYEAASSSLQAPETILARYFNNFCIDELGGYRESDTSEV